MIRGTFKFRWMWPREWWYTRAQDLKRSRRGDYDAAKRLVDNAMTATARQRFRDAVADLVNDTLVPQLADALQTALAEDTTERRVIRAMVQRDFLYAWLVSPNWRALLSYQQLQQSRSWVVRIVRGADPMAEAFADNICELERAITTLSQTHIERTFNPLLIENIDVLRDALTRGSAEDREALVTYFIFRRLRETVLEPALSAYDDQVGR